MLGTDGTISRGQQIRFAPQKVNRPDGTELVGQSRTAPAAHMQNFLESVRGNATPNCPVRSGYKVAIACRMAVDSYVMGVRCPGTRRKKKSFGGRRDESRRCRSNSAPLTVSIVVPTLTKRFSSGDSRCAAFRSRGRGDYRCRWGQRGPDSRHCAGLWGIRAAVGVGRGHQLQAGAQAALGDVLWFVHADSLPSVESIDSCGRRFQTRLWPEETSGCDSRGQHDGAAVELVYPLLRYVGLCYGDSGFSYGGSFRCGRGIPAIAAIRRCRSGPPDQDAWALRDARLRNGDILTAIRATRHAIDVGAMDCASIVVLDWIRPEFSCDDGIPMLAGSPRISRSWQAAFVASVFIALTVAETVRALRQQREAKPLHIGRNLAVAAFAGVVMNVMEEPLVAQLTRHRLYSPWWAFVGILLLDYTLYVWHVLTHRVPFLWRFHLPHHVDLDLDASTALRFHFGEMLLAVPYRALQVTLLGIDYRTYSIWQTFLFASSFSIIPICDCRRLSSAGLPGFL